jgi:hypothetical protein
MTIVRGESIMAARCCGARYALPRYLSMNDRSSAYWTDGWREQSLMPNDEGLRQCKCGRFVVLRELVEIDRAETSDLPRVEHVSDEMLPACIAQAESEEVEVAARLTHWRLLNHPYRQRYREHRAAEEAATQAAWETANPDRRTRWDRLLRRPGLTYQRPPGSPMTHPPFEPTDEQLRNMERLGEVLQAWCDASRQGYSLDLAELYREQSRFKEAALVMAGVEGKRPDATVKLMNDLISEKVSAPIRYKT